MRRRNDECDKAIARAHADDNLQAVDKLTEVVDGRRRIVDQLPLIGHVPGDDEMERIGAAVRGLPGEPPRDHRHLLDRFQLVDAARKVVGVGSVGTRCWIVLLDGGGDDDPLILQVKEAEASVLEAQLQPSGYPSHGRRVVEGQWLMQAASDVFLGWTPELGGARLLLAPAPGHEGFRRCRRPTPRHVPPVRGTLRCDPCSGHARSGDAAAISGYLGKGNEFAKALARFARTYADQNERDHAALQQAIKDGRVPTETGI